MNALRVTVEWGFGRVLNPWNELRNVKALQPVRSYYKAAVILYNIHCIFRPNQMNQYFNCTPYTWEDYKHVCEANCQL